MTSESANNQLKNIKLRFAVFGLTANVICTILSACMQSALLVYGYSLMLLLPALDCCRALLYVCYMKTHLAKGDTWIKICFNLTFLLAKIVIGFIGALYPVTLIGYLILAGAFDQFRYGIKCYRDSVRHSRNENKMYQNGMKVLKGGILTLSYIFINYVPALWLAGNVLCVLATAWIVLPIVITAGVTQRLSNEQSRATRTSSAANVVHCYHNVRSQPLVVPHYKANVGACIPSSLHAVIPSGSTRIVPKHTGSHRFVPGGC